MKSIKKKKQNWRKRINMMSLLQKETAFMLGSLLMLILFVAEMALTMALKRNEVIMQMVTEILIVIKCIINSLLYIIVGRKLCVTQTAVIFHRLMSVAMILIGMGMLWCMIKWT